MALAERIADWHRGDRNNVKSISGAAKLTVLFALSTENQFLSDEPPQPPDRINQSLSLPSAVNAVAKSSNNKEDAVHGLL
jgi:hypothetical protein